MEKVTKKEVERAVKAYNAARIRKAEIEAQIAQAEETIATYSLDNIASFVDSRLALASGVIGIKAGAAKPVTLDGERALSTAARTALAVALPKAYVKLALDLAGLYKSEDKNVRQILAAQGVKIIKEDKFVVL